MSRSRMMVVHQEGLRKASQAFAEGEFEERMGGMVQSRVAVSTKKVIPEARPLPRHWGKEG